MPELEPDLGKSGFAPKTSDDARYMLFAFAELSGYTLLRDMPPLRGELELKARTKALSVDWDTRWIELPDRSGWRVSCVFVTMRENWSCDRYEIEIKKDGSFKIISRKDIFCAFGII